MPCSRAVQPSPHGATLHGDVTRVARACAETARGLILVGPEPAYRPEAARAVARLGGNHRLSAAL